VTGGQRRVPTTAELLEKLEAIRRQKPGHAVFPPCLACHDTGIVQVDEDISHWCECPRGQAEMGRW
jgi:hypothetical protein